MDLTIRVDEKEGEFVASCPELDVHSYGPTKEWATMRLKKVIVFYAETASQMGYDIDAKNLLSSISMNSSEEFSVYH